MAVWTKSERETERTHRVWCGREGQSQPPDRQMSDKRPNSAHIERRNKIIRNSHQSGERLRDKQLVLSFFQVKGEE